MANTESGGVVLVGVTDGGEIVGAETDAEWLRGRVYDLTGRKLLVDIGQREIAGKHILVIVCPPTEELIEVKGKIKHRVGDRCVNMDYSSVLRWQEGKWGYDWSAQDSGVSAEQVRPEAVAIVRSHLRMSPDGHDNDLAELPNDRELLSRLGALFPSDTRADNPTLTQAAALLFTANRRESLDYIRRAYSGADSAKRIRESHLSVLEQLQLCLDQLESSIPVTHLNVPLGGAIPQYSEIPLLAAREAIVNGLAHRDWSQAEPTVVEHEGAKLRVSSPGGFYKGVTADNILSHPSLSRNQELTRLFAKIRLAEREGVGVDRMYRDQLIMGASLPEFREISGVSVQTTLVGGAVDSPWVIWRHQMSDERARADIRILLFLRHLVTEGWCDLRRAAALVQESERSVEDDCRHLLSLKIGGETVVTDVRTPAGASPAWTLSSAAVTQLQRLDAQGTPVRDRFPTRAHVALSYAYGRGRISSSELASLVGASTPNVIPVLKELAENGDLVPSSPTGKGRGFHYTPAPTPEGIRRPASVSRLR